MVSRPSVASRNHCAGFLVNMRWYQHRISWVFVKINYHGLKVHPAWHIHLLRSIEFHHPFVGSKVEPMWLFSPGNPTVREPPCHGHLSHLLFQSVIFGQKHRRFLGKTIFSAQTCLELADCSFLNLHVLPGVNHHVVAQSRMLDHRTINQWPGPAVPQGIHNEVFKSLGPIPFHYSVFNRT